MIRIILPLVLAAIASPAAAGDDVFKQQLRRTVTTLVGFGTRHSLSSATDPRRGIGAARTWAAGEFARLARDCGGCLNVERLSRTFVGPRALNGVVIEDVLGSSPARIRTASSSSAGTSTACRAT